MPKKRFSAEQIVTLLRQIEVSMAPDTFNWSRLTCPALATQRDGPHPGLFNALY